MEPTLHKHGSRNQFASDNYAGICPEAWEAMQEANHGFSNSYGDDVWTEKACNALREFFDAECQVFFVFNGTAAKFHITGSQFESSFSTKWFTTQSK